MKVALVHDFLTSLGGAERVLVALHQLFPSAPVYTLAYSAKGTKGQFEKYDIREAKLAKSFLGRRRTLSSPFLPNAVESFDLSEFDVVISSSSAFSKGVITRPETLHICYCHTPMRYVWDWTHEYAKENNYDRGVRSVFGRLLTHYLRIWDQASAERVDVWLANSQNVAKRIKKYYRQDSRVIHPPVNMPNERKTTKLPSDKPYFLIISRLSPYKKIDLAIEACARLHHLLVIIGEGSDRTRLEKLANELKAPITFLGYKDDQTTASYWAHARAFLFPGEDDFGITPVEAMSYGKPVIAYGKGGALETVVDGTTGIFFNEPRVESLTEAIEQFEKTEKQFKPVIIKKQAKKFSSTNFKKSIAELVEKEWEKFNDKN